MIGSRNFGRLIRQVELVDRITRPMKRPAHRALVAASRGCDSEAVITRAFPLDAFRDVTRPPERVALRPTVRLPVADQPADILRHLAGVDARLTWCRSCQTRICLVVT